MDSEKIENMIGQMFMVGFRGKDFCSLILELLSISFSYILSHGEYEKVERNMLKALK